jgi:CelD/BcsL family acetyltransferase involved in cellulose biosynthesis
MARAGLLDLRALRLDGRAIAVQYGFRDARRAYPYLGGFDPALASWSPGTTILAAVIEAALRRGAAEVDFLRGREPYKYRWGVRDRPTMRRRVTR